MANSLTGGWHSTGGSGYYNRFTGEAMSGGDFLNNTPYLTSPEYVDYSPGAIANAVMGSREMELLPGTDPLGNRMAIFTYPNGKVSGGPVPFWDITGSYYNELYYFSGLVAFDTYAAKESMSYWDMIRTTDFPKPIMGMPPGLGMGTLGTYAKLAKITKGYKGAIQAHHLVEVRHLKRLMLSTRSSPAVILSKADHAALTKSLQQLLPYGNTYTRSQLINAYQQAYSSYPEWIKIVTKFLQ